MAEAKCETAAVARHPGFTARCAASAFALLVATAAVVPAPADADDKAHAIADQFSGASAAKKANGGTSDATDSLKSYEDEMLARAREEAQARAKADLAAAEEKAARERAEAAAAAARAADQAKADAQAKAAVSADDEARALSERLRAAREAHEAKQAAEREAAAAAERAAAESEARAAALAAAEAKRREASLAMARARLAERARHLGERAENARLARLASEATAVRAAADAAEWERSSRDAAGAEPANADIGEGGGTVTVLIVMDAGSRGIRRWNKTADPMLCVDETCYISRGAATPAKRISRSKAFGPGVALGERAGDCRNQLVCAFRGVVLENGRSWMQPIDLRIMRHDRREAKLVVADPTCSVTTGKLVCTRTVTSGDYRAWIVPETLAERAGAKAIEAALVAELQSR